MSEELKKLKHKVKELEKENEILRRGITSFIATGDTVSVPENFKTIFNSAEDVVKKIFYKIKSFTF